MSKEANGGIDCICGQRIAYPEYHWPHCKMNPANLSVSERRHMATKFTDRELNTIKAMGLAKIKQPGETATERSGQLRAR